MENIWFYTLSAIPQVLSAIVGLIAIFVVFKIDQIKRRAEKEREEILPWILVLSDSEIHNLSQWDNGDLLTNLEIGINNLDVKKSRLSYSKYNELCDLYHSVIRSYGRRYSPNEERIYLYLLEKRRILSSLIKNRVNVLFYFKNCLKMATPVILSSIFFLPLYKSDIQHKFVLVLLISVLACTTLVLVALATWKIASPSLE